MASFTHTLGGERFRFGDLKELLAKATPLRSGDQLAGLAAETEIERAAAQSALADVSLAAILDEPVVPYEADEVTRRIVDGHDVEAFASPSHMTVGELRDWLLSDAADAGMLARVAPGLTPEMAAAVSKIMRAQDFVTVARK